VVGPFLIYCNAAADHDALWKDALAQARKEAEAWPYDWVRGVDYPRADQRGTVTGTLTVTDPQAPHLNVRNLLVGVTPYDGDGRPVNWQMDAKYYQFWARADAKGRFKIGA